MVTPINKISDIPNKNCNNLEGNETNNGEDISEKCQKWLDTCTISDSCSVYSDSNNSVLTESTSSAIDSGLVFHNSIVAINNDGYKSVIIQDNKVDPKYDNVNIYKSKKVHVGDVTYINGPVIITNSSSAYKDKKISVPYNEPYKGTFIVDRTNWLAQPALGEKEYLKEPVPYVIIAHTATEEGFSQAENTLLIRLIQSFHIESRKWKDTSYNFLIGSDGLAYEGRGWGVIGAHTRGYNCKSIGIAFVGCFIDHLPPKAALKKAQELIETGVKKGSIASDYKLLAHCQCSPTMSPGTKLYEEIKTWDHWDASVTVHKSNIDCVVEEVSDYDLKN
ncbi:peptidoglycan-recognition protein LE-like [Diorhabda sublineata]|uniref:peptidoglycan-recognition protein LE-like n=1 Tax=Diorhabda sublineata TaxID=1163346 RepID=UPI0024E0E7B2|nr:peptidoglycan-recognition protein LE-like [Diorhabda sublineata]